MSLLLWVCPWNWRRVADHLMCDSKNLVPLVFRSVAETFNLLHELRRGLHSRGQQQHNRVSILSTLFMNFWIHSHKHLIHLHFATVNHHCTVYCCVFDEHHFILSLLSSVTLLCTIRYVRLLPWRKLCSSGLYRSKEVKFPQLVA
jgi:hypothetical protein